MSTITATAQLRIDDRDVSIRMNLPVEPVRPSDLLPIFRGVAGMMTQIGVEYAAESGAAVSCRSGCGACCRQLVPVTRMEARRLAEVVAEMPEARRSEVLDRFKQALAELDRVGMHERLMNSGEYGEGRGQALGLEYFALQMACPFLESESCSIYEERPIACREYLVSSPAKHCARPSADTIEMIPLPAKVSAAVTRLESMFRMPPPPAGELQIVPLVLALEWAAKNPSDEREGSASEIMQRLFAEFRSEQGKASAAGGQKGN